MSENGSIYHGRLRHDNYVRLKLHRATPDDVRMASGPRWRRRNSILTAKHCLRFNDERRLDRKRTLAHSRRGRRGLTAHNHVTGYLPQAAAAR